MSLKETILNDLATEFAQSRISTEDYEKRVERVIACGDDSSLLMLNADILPISRYQENSSKNTYSVKTHDEEIRRRDLVAIFGGSMLKGIFKAPRRINCIALFGGVDMDFRKASIPAEGIEIDIGAMFGGVNIIVPYGLRVDVHGFGIFGAFNKPRHEEEDGPVITIKGIALFGGVDVKYKD